EIEEGNISRFFSYIFGSFETLAQNKNLHFNVHQNYRSLAAKFDADKLEKITTNLLSNAFKFTPTNGRVEVNIEYTPKDTTIDVVLTVSDNGIGIDSQRLPRIFDRFYQVDDTSHRNYEGTGIGLALVKELVEILKGKISVESEVNKGTTFRVAFTLAASQQKNGSTEPIFETTHTEMAISMLLPEEGVHDQNLAPTDEQPVLLIVEDNPDLRLYLRKIFETQYQVMEANDGQQGVEMALQIVPDMVITDLMMPRLDGFGVCERLKTDVRTSHIPVVLLTAKATLTDRLEGLGLGADEYLQKPFNKEELLIRVKNLLQQRNLLREKFSLRSAALPSAPAVGNEVSQQLDNQFIERIRSVIEAHLSESNFDVEGLCKELKISRTNLHRKLKALTGTSATEFIRKIRLQRAAQLAQKETMTVSEIAYQVGFESLSYFSKSFQEEFGMLPSEYGRLVE
ncbi:DNA-binding response OmpR family regulator/two-component sensor histidine kinase, partial [Runella defluvii]